MKSPPMDQAVAVMDFAENFTIQAQDEIESAHWVQTTEAGNHTPSISGSSCTKQNGRCTRSPQGIASLDG